MSFVWKGQTISTMGETLSAAASIIERGDEQEADEFLAAYQAFSPHARENLGYGFGYLSHDQMVAGLRLFKLEHPVLGDADSAEKITPEQAFEMGKQLGEDMRAPRG